MSIIVCGGERKSVEDISLVGALLMLSEVGLPPIAWRFWSLSAPFVVFGDFRRFYCFYAFAYSCLFLTMVSIGSDQLVARGRR